MVSISVISNEISFKKNSEEIAAKRPIVKASNDLEDVLHYTFSFLKPNIETDLKFITEKESRAYNKFLKDYNNFWREFFDPIGIRFKMRF